MNTGTYTRRFKAEVATQDRSPSENLVTFPLAGAVGIIAVALMGIATLNVTVPASVFLVGMIAALICGAVAVASYDEFAEARKAIRRRR